MQMLVSILVGFCFMPRENQWATDGMRWAAAKSPGCRTGDCITGAIPRMLFLHWAGEQVTIVRLIWFISKVIHQGKWSFRPSNPSVHFVEDVQLVLTWISSIIACETSSAADSSFPCTLLNKGVVLPIWYMAGNSCNIRSTRGKERSRAIFKAINKNVCNSNNKEQI